jgi:hypothetical protein
MSLKHSILYKSMGACLHSVFKADGHHCRYCDHECHYGHDCRSRVARGVYCSACRHKHVKIRNGHREYNSKCVEVTHTEQKLTGFTGSMPSLTYFTNGCQTWASGDTTVRLEPTYQAIYTHCTCSDAKGWENGTCECSTCQ